MQFRYVAYTTDRGVVRGRLGAISLVQARVEIAQRGLKLLELRPAIRVVSLERLFPSLFGVGTGELVQFCRHLAVMLTSGGSLMRALETLERQSRNVAIRRTVESLRRQLAEGASLSAALREHRDIFGPLFVSVVEVGENTGRLGPALEQMADILEKEHEARQKALQTMAYPVAIIALSLITVGVLMAVAMPPLLRVFETMGAEVPLTTRLLVEVVRQAKAWLPYLPFAGIAAGLLVVLARRHPRVRWWAHVTASHLPIVGNLTVAGELSRFSRTIALLLEAGVPLATALRLGINGCKNMVMKKAFVEAEEALTSGQPLAPALKRHSVVPAMFIELVVIGEESNTLRRTMNDAAVVYQKRFDQRLNALLAALEPASTLVVGAIVGILAFAMFLPIYSGLNALR